MSIVANPVNGFYAGSVLELKNTTTTDSGTRSNDGYSMELIAGPAVTDLLFKNPGFQKSWDRLFESCPWATVFQSRQFISVWYKVYQVKHLPILVRAVEKGQLAGVLPMVLLNANANAPHSTGKESRITGAGHYDAPYQTWLAAPSDGEAFIKKALAELMKQFPGHPISFRFLTPGTPLDWIKDDQKWRRRSIVQTYTRPLINFRDPGHAKLFRGSHFRNKLNRLKKLGEFHFEHIMDLETFESSLDEMVIMYDFRQSALFNKNHFKEEPEKKDFLLELFRLHLLHVTVLKVNEKIVAAVVAVAGKNDWVHLAGINCHSPVKARWYSPGFMHFILLFKQLAKESTQYFDLTPGYDAYKEDLANGHDEVMEWVISSKLKFRIKKKIRKWMHTRLIAAGIRPMTAELTLKKYRYRVRHWRAGPVIKRLTKSLHKKRKQQLYLIQTDTLTPDVKTLLHKDCLNDLMEYNPRKGTEVTRWAFLSDGLRRLEKGQHCYTLMENGRLLCCAWFSYPDIFSAEKNNNPATENTAVLESFYCHAAGKDRLSSFLNGVVTDIEASVNKEKSSIYLRSDDLLFCRTLESAGFQVV